MASTNYFDHDDDEVTGDEVARMKLSQDLRAAAALMSPTQQRVLVDMYYQVQENRKRTHNQLRAAKEEPNNFIATLAAYQMREEKMIVAALDVSTDQTVVGRWCKLIFGVGPIIAAGLQAHINIERTPKPSSLLRYMGQDTTLKWLGAEGAKKAVAEAIAEYKQLQGNTEFDFFSILPQLGERIGVSAAILRDVLNMSLENIEGSEKPRDPETLTRLLVDEFFCDYDELWEHVQALLDPLMSSKFDLFYVLPLLSQKINYKPETLVRLVRRAMEQEETKRLTEKLLCSVVAKRPWNAKAKVLCFKLGSSFNKFYNNPKCIYGHIYAEWKVKEIANNDAGLYVDQAQETLRTRNIADPDTLSWYKGCYPAGTTAKAVAISKMDQRIAYLKSVRLEPGEGQQMLPLGRLEMRARRRAVKRFLHHYFQVAYESHYGKPAPLPYILAKDPQLHTQFVPAPGWSLEKGLVIDE